jgi:hypothetical protein
VAGEAGGALGDRFLEFRQITRHGIPDDVQIDIEVAMGDPVSHITDNAPGHFRMRVADLIVYPSCRFADNLYPVKHRALQQLVSVEARAIILNVAPNPIDCAQHVC